MEKAFSGTPTAFGKAGPTGIQGTQEIVYKIHITSVANTWGSVFKKLRSGMIFRKAAYAHLSFYFCGYEPPLGGYVAPEGKERGSHLYTEEPVF